MTDRSPIPHPGDWPVVHLGEITTKIGSGATPTGGEDSYLPERTQFALVRSQNVFDRHFESTGLAFISDEQASRLQGVVLQPGDLLLNITGDGITFARACAVPVDVLPACVNQHVAIVRVNRAVADPGYVLSYLTHPAVKSYIESFNAGGSRRAITKGHIESFEIALPPLAEQRAIAYILGTLDDKIELNRRMNETLEAMAQALFKSWFVDFDPVRAKAEGRQPARMDVGTAALFPDRFIESELGLLPKGWDIKPVREIIEDLFDGPHATPAEASEGAVYLGIKNLTGTQIDLTEIRYISELDWPEWTKRVVPRPHDIVFTYEATLGAFSIVPADLRCCLGRRLALVRPKTGQLDYCFLFHTFVSKAFQELLMARANQGSTVNRIPLIDFPKYPVIWPARQLIDRFHRLAEPLWSRIHQNQAEARNLVAIRDLLLPRLISGELRVKDAERVLTDTPV